MQQVADATETDDHQTQFDALMRPKRGVSLLSASEPSSAASARLNLTLGESASVEVSIVTENESSVRLVAAGCVGDRARRDQAMGDQPMGINKVVVQQTLPMHIEGRR